jgi:CDP-diacylglycerol pyrophosphatase
MKTVWILSAVAALTVSTAFATFAVGLDQWAPIGAVIPHSMFWGLRIRGTDLPNVEPFRLAADALAGKTNGPGDLTIAVAGVRVESDDEFLILASYAKAPHAWWPVGSDDLLDSTCPAGPRLAG